MIVGIVGVVTAACTAGSYVGSTRLSKSDVLDLPGDIQGVALAVGGGYVWVLGIEQNDERSPRPAWLYQVDPATLTFVGVPIAAGTVRSDRRCCDITVGEGVIWVAHSGSLWRIDSLGERAVTRIPIPVDTVDSVSAGEGSVWAVSGGAVHSIDPRTAEVIATIPLKAAKHVTVGGGGIWVTASGALVRIDPTTKEVSARIRIFPLSEGLVFGHNAVWLASRGLLIQVHPGSPWVTPRRGE